MNLLDRVKRLEAELESQGEDTKHTRETKKEVVVPTLSKASTGVSVLRAGDPGFAEAIAALLGLPLDVFAEIGDQLLEVRVPWHAETLWFVPTDGDVPVLVGEGVSRGRIWTARELEDLLGVPGITTEGVQVVALAKITFGGDIAQVRRG